MRFDPSQASGGMIDGECHGHFVIETVDDYKDGQHMLHFNYSCLADDKGMVGRSGRETIWLTKFGSDEWDFGTLKELFIACHLVTREECEEAASNGQELDLDEKLLEGRSFCGELRKKKDKADVTFGKRYWSVFSKRAAEVPKDMPTVADMAESLSIPLPEWMGGKADGGQQQASKPRQQPARQQKAAAAASNGVVESYDDV